MRQRFHFAVAARGPFGEQILPGARRHVITPIISALAPDIASTAFAQVAAPAITGALVGAGTGALTHGNIGTDALIGGLGGGALGYAMSGPNDQLTGALSNALGFGGGGGGAGGVAPPNVGDTGWMPVTDSGGAPAASTDTGWYSPENNPTDFPAGTTPASVSGQAANVAGGGGGLFGGKPGGISGTSVALGALAGLGSMFNKPKVGTWQTPNPTSVAANTGPYFNAPLNTNVPGRTATPPPASTDWYTYGQRPEQSYFSGNSLQNYGFAHGGALDHRVFDTRSGQQFVRGPGTGTSDQVPARLSDGEYVLTAADVSRLGGGSNERGAAKLDHDRGALAHLLDEKKFVRKPLASGKRRAA